MKKPIYLDYSATTPVDPRVAARDDPVPDRAVRQSGVALARVRLDDREGGRGGARGSRQAGQLRPARTRLDLGRDGSDQPRAQGRRALLQGQGQAPDHGQDRAQGDARHHARTRARGFRGHVSRRASRRPARSRRVQGGAAAGHDPGLGDVRQQRDRRHPGHRGDRRDLPRARASSSTSTRRRRRARSRSTWRRSRST